MILEPNEIERESMRIIQEEIKNKYSGSTENFDIIKRVIHATADFDFLKNLEFSDNAVSKAREALKNGKNIIVDTAMLSSGINKNITKKFNIEIICYSSEENIKKEAKERKVTRAIVNIEHSVKNFPDSIYVIGNAPTALIRLCELVKENKAKPSLIIGVPVGFVNVIESKKLLSSLENNIPKIISHGRKGGSTVACAIVNALLYGL